MHKRRREPPPEPVIDAGWVCRRYAAGAHARILAQLLRSGRLSVDDVDTALWEWSRANYLRAEEEAARKMAMLDDMIDQHLSRGDLAAAASCAEDAALLQRKLKIELGKFNFELADYIDKNGELRRMFDITRGSVPARRRLDSYPLPLVDVLREIGASHLMIPPLVLSA